MAHAQVCVRNSVVDSVYGVSERGVLGVLIDFEFTKIFSCEYLKYTYTWADFKRVPCALQVLSAECARVSMEHGTEGQHLIIIYYVNLPPGESGDEYIEREDYPMCQQVYDSEEYENEISIRYCYEIL